MAHIDTLKVFDKLIASGLTPEQARMHSEILNSSFDGVATKEDLHQLESRIESKFDSKLGLIEKACIAIIVLLLKIAIWP